MKLFDKDKDFILKITNAILLIWFITALVISFTLTLDLVFKDEELTYEEYKIISCRHFESDDEAEVEDTCQDSYSYELLSNKKEDKNHKKSLAVALFNVVLVTLITLLLNKTKVLNKNPKKK